jgi:PTH1 family peptidyl-tRNA hydrolase
MVVDAVARALGVRLGRVWLRPYAMARTGVHYLVEPRTYMNRSGEILADLLRRTGSEPADLLIVYDNVDLPPGTCRLKARGSGGGSHRGIDSLERTLGTTEFGRLAVGVGRPHGGPLVAHVLGEPGPDERPALLEGVARAVECVLRTLGRSTHGAAG